MNIFPFNLSFLILSIPVIMTYCIIGTHAVFGQAALPPGLQPLPQDYYVITQPPKGIVVQDSNLEITDVAGVGAVLASVVAYVKGHLVGKLANKTAETTKEQSEQIVQSKQVEQCITKAMFDLAPEEKVKAMEGTAPEIKLEQLAKNKEAAVKTATKA